MENKSDNGLQFTVREAEVNDMAREREILLNETLEARDKFAGYIMDDFGKEILEQLKKNEDQKPAEQKKKKERKFIKRLLTILRNDDTNVR